MATRYGNLRTTVRSLRRTFSTTSDTHADFSRVVKASPTGSTQDRIAGHLKDSKVVLYMKGLPSAPQCGFSWKTVQILNAMGVEYRAHNVLVDEDLRQGIKQFSAWPTIPQVYVDGEFVGGLDIVEEMARSGELKILLHEKGALDADEQKAAAEQAKKES